MGKGGGFGGYTGYFWCLSFAAAVALALVVVGHVLISSGEATERGELPLWYQIEACQNMTGTISTTPTGEVTLCAKEVTSCPTSWNMHVARKAPKDETETETACPAVVEEQEELRIALEPDDGFLEGPPYSPVFALPTGASALISFKIEDGEGGTLLPTTNAELGPGTTYPWRELSNGRGAILLPPGAPPSPSPSAPPPTPPTAPPPPPSYPIGGLATVDGVLATRSSDPAHCDIVTRCEAARDAENQAVSGYSDDDCKAKAAVMGVWSTTEPLSTRRVQDDWPFCSITDPVAYAFQGAQTCAAYLGAYASYCETLKRCTSCTPPSAPSLRRLAATEADPHEPASLVEQEALRGVQVEDAAEAAAERDVVPAPGSRRLLKGGYSSRGGTSSSSSRGFSKTGRTSGYSSGYSRSTSRTSYSTSSYSSYRADGYYSNSYGGSYYGGGRPYGYHYGYGGYRTSTSIYIVRPYYYGCYSCGRRTCHSCGNCNTRRECNGEEAYTTAAPLDRYEFLDSKFKMQKARWPAFLVIHNATIFTSTPGAASAYVTFFRDGSEPEAGAGGVILALAYIAFACILLTCCWFQQQGKLKLRPEPVYAEQLQFVQPQVAQPQMMIQAAGGYPQAAGGYPQAVGGYPQAVGGMMPVAQPAPSAMAMATAYPQAVQPTMPGYPQAVPMAQSGYPQAQAYPSAPASPPASPDSPSEPVVEKKDE